MADNKWEVVPEVWSREIMEVYRKSLASAIKDSEPKMEHKPEKPWYMQALEDME